MSNHAEPSIALVGLPGLRDPLRRAGYLLLSDHTDLEPVTGAAREARRAGTSYIVIAAAPQAGQGDDGLDSWLARQAAAHLVLVVCGDGMSLARDLPARVKTHALPCTVNELMALFGAQPLPEGDVTVTVAQALGRSGVQPDPVLDSDGRPEDSSGEGSDSLPWPLPWAADAPVPDPDRNDAPAGEGPAGPATARFGARAPGRWAPQRGACPVPSAATALAEEVAPVVPGFDRRPERDLGAVVVVWAAKGGVGKSTLSLAVAQHAGQQSASPGLGKVVVVDANRGQGDLRRYLRLDGPHGLALATIYDAYVSDAPANPVVGPGSINAARTGPNVSFGVVLAPRDGQVHRDVVTAAAYRDAIGRARRLAGLVVIDTQIVESQDAGDILAQVLAPLLVDDPRVWSLAVTDTSLPGVGNLLSRLGELQALGLPRERAMAVVNLAMPGQSLDTRRLAARLSRYAELVGTIPADPAVHAAIQGGRPPNLVPAVGRVLDAVLWRVTGLDVFAADRFAARPRRWRALLGGR